MKTKEYVALVAVIFGALLLFTYRDKLMYVFSSNSSGAGSGLNNPTTTNNSPAEKLARMANQAGMRGSVPGARLRNIGV